MGAPTLEDTMDCPECASCASGWWYLVAGFGGLMTAVILSFVADLVVNRLDRLLNRRPRIEIDIKGYEE